MDMKIFLRGILITFCIVLHHFAIGQSGIGMHPVTPVNNPMHMGVKNYKTFSAKVFDNSSEMLNANKGYERHPELGFIYDGAPDANCYEILSNRTEINKTFIKKGSNGSVVYTQTGSAPLHYKDNDGNWRTILTKLSPDNTMSGVFAAYEQPAPVVVNTNRRFSSIGKDNQRFQFNNNLELLYEKPDGSQVSLGRADWANYNAGDDGIYVSNAWSGIDIEMNVLRGAVKTNFILNKAMPEYAAGKLLLRDHPVLSSGLALSTEQGKTFTGSFGIVNESGENVYEITGANAAEKGHLKETFRELQYSIHDDVLDIVLPGDFLDRGVSSYPIIIDPLVTLATHNAVTGSSYSTDLTIPCVYTNAATRPANATITDIQYAFTYATGSTAWISDGAVDFRLGSCRSPAGATGLTGLYYFCNVSGPGSCAATGGTTCSIFNDLSTCIPCPYCPSSNLNITMDFYQMTGATAACATTYIYATTPLVITIVGHTIESFSGSLSQTICLGTAATLNTAHYGVQPYTYSVSPGTAFGTPAMVSPSSTTVYTVTATDQCGITTTDNFTVVVDSASGAFVGSSMICLGTTSTLGSAVSGGTWVSSNPSVASVSAGVVTGNSAGTADIDYTASAGCTSNYSITVDPLPCTSTSPCGTTSVANGLSTHSLKIYPNPAFNELQVTTGQDNTCTIIISNSMGRVCKRQTITGGTGNINIDGLQNGIYFVSVIGENGYRVNGRFLKI